MNGSRQQKRVLVVEDDPYTRTLFRDVLTTEGYTVVQASNGYTALRLAEQQLPHVILLDLALPEVSGLDVLQKLKSSERTRSIPVVVVSAYPLLMRVRDACRADSILRKPCDLADLLARVQEAAASPRPAHAAASPSAADRSVPGAPSSPVAHAPQGYRPPRHPRAPAAHAPPGPDTGSSPAPA